MRFKDKISSLEKELSIENKQEFESNCEKIADEICKDAIEKVEKAIKYQTYKKETKGFLWNAKTIKYVEGCTLRLISVNPRKEGPYPRPSSVSDEIFWVVKSEQDRKYFVELIIKKLEKEGFECWTTSNDYYTGCITVNYKMEWE